MSNQSGTSFSNEDTRTYFEKQRDALLADISMSMENVLNNINALNRDLEGAFDVGKEFRNVSVLWSHFYQGLPNYGMSPDEGEQPENAPADVQEKDEVVPESLTEGEEELNRGDQA
ncbi:DASH complex subunit DAD1 [Nadsonia fulvescens var. elongata DSM 6958]|uniref:DASH complex subunit DAD1 n=1 Tax=Nadsonia fulvescens var. elongata DSM 6958 TaxID=857566 RepID=A0A1E3PI93_9ASCO|nr:DASH complex subunit DAD1 [Nadsonia fulvescens var. elongata DSM 6958]